MFRQRFMTIDPATKFGSRRDLMPPDGSRRNFEELRGRLEGKPSLIVEEPPTGYNSGQTLDIGRLITESRGRLHGEKVGIPRPSLMLGKSEYTYHLNQTHHAGKVSQKAIQAQHLSPRSSRLLASTKFMNRTSTANSTLFQTRVKSGTSQTASGRLAQ